jgi:hypothetical protein
MQPGAEIQQRVAALAARGKCGDLSFGLSFGAQRVFSADGRPCAPGGAGAGGVIVLLGCITKLLTGLVLTEKIQAVGACLDDEILPFFAHTALSGCPQLNGVTFSHLLSHTHGLDSSAFTGFPLSDPDGCIDCHWLGEQLAAMNRLHPPGGLYSYNNLGAILAAALLEQRFQVDYQALLRQHLLETLGIGVLTQSLHCAGEEADHEHRLSPAVGGCLGMGVNDLTRFVEHWAGSIASKPARVIALPGWHPLESGVCLGWKYYGSGWFGHGAEFAHASLLIRCRPAQKAALIVASNNAPNAGGAFLALINVFRNDFPELAKFRFPRLLPTHALGAMDFGKYAGSYANHTATVAIAPNPAPALPLALTVTRRDGSPTAQTSVTTALKVAEGGIFLLEPPDPDLFPFLQFSQPAADGSCGYLWNGRHLWRRMQ